jgi:hypothetical protein
LTEEEVAALQGDLLNQGTQGQVANLFRQENPGATEEEIADFVERSLANIQVGFQNRAGALGVDPKIVGATLGKKDGPGATAKGKTKEEQSLLSEAEKIQQEQLKLIEGTVNQNTDLLTAQQDIYKQKIIETTAALGAAADAFAALREETKNKNFLHYHSKDLSKQNRLLLKKLKSKKKRNLMKQKRDWEKQKEKNNQGFLALLKVRKF